MNGMLQLLRRDLVDGCYLYIPQGGVAFTVEVCSGRIRHRFPAWCVSRTLYHPNVAHVATRDKVSIWKLEVPAPSREHSAAPAAATSRSPSALRRRPI